MSPVRDVRAATIARCSEVLGQIEQIADLSLPHGDALVLHLRDRDGTGWIAKAAVKHRQFTTEHNAYQRWVPALGTRSPQLHSAHDDLQLLIVNQLPGFVVEGRPAESQAATYEQAGALTRLLHDSVPPVPNAAFTENLSARLDEYVSRGAGLLSSDDIGFARTQLTELQHLTTVSTVPCHSDNQPRNWLIDEADVVRLIDFGQTSLDVWIQDVSRLYFQCWQNTPQLQTAFFAGYGKQPDDADWHILFSYAAYSALSTVVWAHEHHDPGFEARGRAMLALLRATRRRTR